MTTRGVINYEIQWNISYKRHRLKQVVDNYLEETVPQLSWLERYTDNVEVPSSSLGGTTSINAECFNGEWLIGIID